MTSSENHLATSLYCARLLAEPTTGESPSKENSDVLKKRLSAYFRHRNDDDALQHLESMCLKVEIELLLAQESLLTIKRVQTIVDLKMNEGQEEPLLGTRDLALLRTLLSFAVRWGLVPLYTRFSKTWISLESRDGNLTFLAEDLSLLSKFATSYLSLVLPDGAQGRISQTQITGVVLSRHIPELFLASVALGWLPESTLTSPTAISDSFRALFLRVAKLLSASQTISALMSIISSAPPRHIRNVCSSLLTNQLLRPDGVDGLCRTMFAEDSFGDEIQLDKLEQVARVLNSVPSTLEPRDYFATVFPRVIQVMTRSSETSHRRAAAFAIYRGLVPKKMTKTSAAATNAIRNLLHDPFLHHSTSMEEPPSRLRAALDAIVTLFGNAEPSPAFVSKLLSPIIVPLYELLFDLGKHKTLDPELKESLLGLLKSWARIVGQFEGEQVLMLIIESEKNWVWSIDSDGNVWKTPRQKQESPTILLPQEAVAVDEGGYDLNLFDHFPDPVHFVETLKAFDREDIASSLFVKLFDRYTVMRGQLDQDPMKIFQVLQIIVQIQKRLSNGATSNILNRPEILFPFIHRVLTSSEMGSAQDDEHVEDDSDDEEGPNSIGPDHDLIETAITLLVSVLEADETSTVTKYAILEEISSALDSLISQGPTSLRAMARGAALVLTARLAQSSARFIPKNKAESDIQEVYQRALKLLQDPMLPVRAHGLFLLRELLSSSRAADPTTLPLVPSILSIFLQSVQDDDSYMYLNGVQGLTMLANRFGKEIIVTLVREYTENLKGLGATGATRRDIEVRTRIGEALSSVIKRCGNALGLYVDLIVPALLVVIRNADIPTVLRTSSISLLADCVDTSPFALLQYIQDICYGMIDLLRVETLAAKNVFRQIEEAGKSHATMSDDPTIKDPTVPAFRRSAIHFLSSYFRAITKLIDDDENLNGSIMLPESLVQMARITLEYISSTDDDGRVRVMAKDSKEGLEDLRRAVLRLP